MTTDAGTCLILGAGRTGRGFIAPLLDRAHWSFSFVDQDPDLIHRIATTPTRVRYFGGRRAEWVWPPSAAAASTTDAAIALFATSSLVLTAVGATNVAAVARQLTRWSELTGHCPPVIACENGIEVDSEVRNAGYRGPAAQAAVFCTTVNDPTGDGLDLVCEDYPSLPFDSNHSISPTPSTFEPRPDFAILMKRKLYTYNAINAAICYAGALRGHTWLAQAAADPTIGRFAERVRTVVDETLSATFEIPKPDQRSFSAVAMAKFGNAEIEDPVSRNIRDTVRKLSPDERIVAPLLLAHEVGQDASPLLELLATAVRWGMSTGEILSLDSLECWELLPASDRAAVSSLLGL